MRWRKKGKRRRERKSNEPGETLDLVHRRNFPFCAKEQSDVEVAKDGVTEDQKLSLENVIYSNETF